jgi:multidrug efflux pump subunit AcrA (membrane-fusion protein)
MKKRNIFIILLFTAAIATILLLPKTSPASGSPSPGGPPAGAAGGAAGGPAAGAGKRRPASTFSVRTTVVEQGTIQDYIEANGDIVFDSTVEVNPYVAGKLVSIRLPLGSKVAQGELIAEIDPSTPGSAYALHQVYAPISGTITSLPLSAGSKVSTTSIIAKIGVLDSGGLQVSSRIAERYIGVLRTGLKANISLEAYPGVRFPATVSRVSPVVDSTSRTKEIRLSFDRPDARINAGMFARIRLDTISYANRLKVPADAVISDSTGSHVFVVIPGDTVAKRPVELGITVDGIAEIRAGLALGDTIVVEGAAVLTDGAKVKVLPTEGKTPERKTP